MGVPVHRGSVGEAVFLRNDQKKLPAHLLPHPIRT
jgi:hypothetical protein